MKERWEGILGTEGRYQISCTGLLKSKSKKWTCGSGTVRSKPDTIMAWAKDQAGYSITSIKINGKKTMVSLHRLLAIYFIPNP